MTKQQMISGQRCDWIFPAIDMSVCTKLAAHYNVATPIIQVLLGRGFTTQELIDEFLFTSLERDVFHGSQLQDAERAIDRILFAVAHKEKMLIAGDYDVDGITSTALMMATLLPLGADLNFFLPNRVKHGYGLSVATIQKAAASGYRVVITVDNGITAHEPALEAKKSGIDLIITDHHKPHAHLPEAYAIVNPQRADCAYPFKLLAGVGVTFKLISLLYEKLGKTIPPKAYELLLLGTIADVVPLRGENRYWVRHGLQLINKQESASLRALKQNSNFVKSKISATDIGFFFTPQLNALGRLEDSRHAVKFLIGTDEEHITIIGAHLSALNEQRKLVEKSAFQSVQERITKKEIDLEKYIVIIDAQDNFPAGVIGLVASRLVSQYGRPAIIFQLTPEGIAKGSCRSIRGVNMFELLESCSDVLLKFGGHAQAAGLAIRTENLPIFKERVQEYVTKLNIQFDARPQITVDATIALAELEQKLIYDLQYLEPFGHQNDEPLFFISSVRQIHPPKLLKNLHVKIQIFSETVTTHVIFFNQPELFSFFTTIADQQFCLVARATENEWNGKKTIELIGIDVSI